MYTLNVKLYVILQSFWKLYPTAEGGEMIESVVLVVFQCNVLKTLSKHTTRLELFNKTT